MQAKKLREGNYIISNNSVVKCTVSDLVEIKAKELIDEKISDRYYIVFNDEWCKRFKWEKFKFNKSEGFYIDLVEPMALLQLTYEKGILSISINGDEIDLPHIKYVHEVQNLYNDLTGKEFELYNEWSNVKVLIDGKEITDIVPLTYIPKER